MRVQFKNAYNSVGQPDVDGMFRRDGSAIFGYAKAQHHQAAKACTRSRDRDSYMDTTEQRQVKVDVRKAKEAKVAAEREAGIQAYYAKQRKEPAGYEDMAKQYEIDSDYYHNS